MQVTETDFGRTEAQLHEKGLNFNFFELGPAQMHTASQRHVPTGVTILQFVEADRAHSARSRPVM